MCGPRLVDFVVFHFPEDNGKSKFGGETARKASSLRGFEFIVVRCTSLVFILMCVFILFVFLILVVLIMSFNFCYLLFCVYFRATNPNYLKKIVKIKTGVGPIFGKYFGIRYTEKPGTKFCSF